MASVYGNFAKSTAAAPASQSITGLGFSPRAVIFFAVNQAADGFQAGYGLSFGVADDSGNVLVYWEAGQDNVASGSPSSNEFTTSLLIIPDQTGSVVAQANGVTFDADGFTLTWAVNDANATIIHYVALDPADVTHALAQQIAGSPVTGLGFSPECVYFTVRGDATPPSSGTIPGIGVATSVADQGTLQWGEHHGASPTANWRLLRDDAMIGDMNPITGAFFDLAQLTSFDADGFSYSGGGTYFALSLRGGGFASGSFNQPTTTGLQQISGLGLVPSVVLIFSACTDITFTGTYPMTTSARGAVGAGSGPTNRGCTWWGSTNGVSPTQADGRLSRSSIIDLVDTASPSAVDASADLQSIDADGFTLNWTTVDASARQLYYLAFGGGTPTGSPSKKLLRGVGL